MAVDGAGNLHIADTSYQRIRSARFDPARRIDNVTQQVMNLNLQQGIKNSLDSKLQAVHNALDVMNLNNDVAAMKLAGGIHQLPRGSQ